ncbi:MAG: Fe-S cluster assembly ATPase SufC [Nitrospinota bacterium]|nr:MAG: Fe-S cluster assembly ATPase SufC [Nitrospinota bacterium]
MADVELVIKDLRGSIEGKEILKGVNLTIKKGEVHALMGPNGSGKSTLAYLLMGHPKYQVDSGEVLYKGENILDMEPDERARNGLFLAFQYPSEIPGVSVSNFLRTALKAKSEASGNGKKGLSIPEFRRKLKEKMTLLQLDDSFASRYLNEGFSGGEKKRMEILQMAMLEPEMAILDETDSGLDIDALRTVAEGVNYCKEAYGMGILLITHYQRILHYIKPDHVHVMFDGRIIASGSSELAEELEAKGYEWLKEAFLAKEEVS